MARARPFEEQVPCICGGSSEPFSLGDIYDVEQEAWLPPDWLRSGILQALSNSPRPPATGDGNA